MSYKWWWIVGGGALLVVAVILFFIFSGNSVQVVGTEAVVVRSQPGEYKPGQVIVFKSADSNTIVTGYIVAIEGNGVYRTQRAANDTSDTQLVQEDQIIGQQLFSVPGAGWVITQVQVVARALANGVSAVWQAVFGADTPLTIEIVSPTPSEAAPTSTAGSGNGSMGSSSGTGGAATPTPVAVTPTATPKASATSAPTATPEVGSTAAPVSEEEITAGILTLPAPSPTP